MTHTSILTDAFLHISLLGFWIQGAKHGPQASINELKVTKSGCSGRRSPPRRKSAQAHLEGRAFWGEFPLAGFWYHCLVLWWIYGNLCSTVDSMTVAFFFVAPLKKNETNFKICTNIHVFGNMLMVHSSLPTSIHPSPVIKFKSCSACCQTPALPQALIAELYVIRVALSELALGRKKQRLETRPIHPELEKTNMMRIS